MAGLSRYRWALGLGLALLLAGLGVWLVLSDSAVYRFLVRLAVDQEFLRDMLQRRGVGAPVVFVAIQALQVVIAPIPGEVTGLVGGFVFGEWLGFIYSSIGLTAGSLVAFWIGRRLGAAFVRRVIDDRLWQRIGFIIEAEGALLCFVIYAVPALPKDIACYLFGLSPMPFWVFAVASTLGRMPGTWLLSAQGAKVATGQYLELALLTAVALMVAVPLYYYRHRIMARRRGRPTRDETLG